MSRDPGRYRDPITIQKLKAEFVNNEMGELDNVDDSHWDVWFACFGEVVVKGTRDFVRAGMAEADCTHLITVPFSDETKGLTANYYRIILESTGEKIHITEAYRKDASNREMIVLGVN